MASSQAVWFCPQLLPDQLVLLLEHLLEQKTVTPRTLQSLERTYHLSEQDAEVTGTPSEFKPWVLTAGEDWWSQCVPDYGNCFPGSVCSSRDL